MKNVYREKERKKEKRKAAAAPTVTKTPTENKQQNPTTPQGFECERDNCVAFAVNVWRQSE